MKNYKHFYQHLGVSRPKGAAVKNIDINIYTADILGSEISVNIDISKGDIDPALVHITYTTKNFLK